MQENLKLYMVLLGCTPKDRLTEQHDIFFGIGTSVEDLVQDMYTFWPNGGRLHVDSWREVTAVDDYEISIVPKQSLVTPDKLFFINLGGYKPGDFEEYHYKTLTVAQSMAQAVKAAKQTAFYKHYSFAGAVSHIDDKYALDADDIHNVQDILPQHLKEKYTIQITKKSVSPVEDALQVGYLKLSIG